MKKALLMVATMLAGASAFAQEAVVVASTTTNTGAYAIAAALAIGIAAFGGALAQGKIGATAMDGIARNPQAQGNMFVSMIIGLVLIESLVIYALVIAFMIVGKL